MIKSFLIFIFLLVSCAYPDIDSVPNFKNVKITEQESIDLCKINKSVNDQIDCILKIYQNTDK